MDRPALSRPIPPPLPAIGLALLAAAFLAPSAPRAQCVPYQDYLRWEGRASGPGAARRIAVSGSHAYVANERGTLQWDGRDDSGRPVPAGVYFLRGDGGVSFARKAIRIR